MRAWDLPAASWLRGPTMDAVVEGVSNALFRHYSIGIGTGGGL